MRGRQASLSGAVLGALLGCSAPGAPQPAETPAARSPTPAASLADLGLMGTIPVFWGEAGDISQMLAGQGEPHWARPVLERHYRLVPLDALDAASLSRVRLLLLAQPRALSAAENVALDAWVRTGGRLVLLADPAMTGESRYAVGDKRRPHDVTLLSPILAHWGLGLEFEEDQAEGYRPLDRDSGNLPVNLAGRFVQLGGAQLCRLSGDGAVARCTIGRGHALLLADAALLDHQAPQPAAGTALEAFVGRGFGTARE